MRTRNVWRKMVVVAIALIATIGSRAAAAQTRTGASVIDGVVSDTNLVVLSEATASILGSNVHVTTGSNGRFQIRGLHSGDYILVIHRLGFKAASVAVEIGATDTLRMSFPLQPIATALDTVSVVGERLTARLSEFDARRKAGFGHFISAADIAQRNAVQLSDLFRNQLSVEILVDAHGKQYAANIRGITSLLGTGYCPYRIFVDDVLMAPAPDLNMLPAPNQIAGIEIYSGGATIPLEYKTTDGAFCGVILIWTKDGS
jgi:hypothetical protein